MGLVRWLVVLGVGSPDDVIRMRCTLSVEWPSTNWSMKLEFWQKKNVTQ